MKPTFKTVAKAVFKKGERFLILHRSDMESAFPGLWDFPGGRLEPGESPEEGLVREVEEETGLRIKPVEIQGKYWVDRKKGGAVMFIVYSAEVVSGDPENPAIGKEHSEYRFATAEEIRQLRTMPFMERYLNDQERDHSQA